MIADYDFSPDEGHNIKIQSSQFLPVNPVLIINGKNILVFQYSMNHYR